MKKLEDIPKKNVFEVPDGYFDRLPGIIEARVAKPYGNRSVSLTLLRYALPAILLAMIGIFWYEKNHVSPLSDADIHNELAYIQPDQLALYLNEHDLSTEELIDTPEWSKDDLVDLENSVYSSLDISHPEVATILDEDDIDVDSRK